MSRRRQDGSHEIDYEVFGSDIQYIEIELDPGETVIAEPGAMMFMEEDIKFETKMGDGSDLNQGLFRKIELMIKRASAKESVFITHFTNRTPIGKRKVGFTCPSPGRIIPIDLSETDNGILLQKGSFICAALGTRLDIDINSNFIVGKFGGEGFIMLHISGDGMAFMHTGGNIVEKYIDDETLRVETGALLAFEPHLKYSVELAGGLKSMMFGGEGVFITTLSGTGNVWLQSLSFEHYTQRITDRVTAELDNPKS